MKTLMSGWTQKPTSTPGNIKMRTVPELLAAIPEMLDGVVVLSPEFIRGLKTLCNVSAPSDVSKPTHIILHSLFVLIWCCAVL